MSPLYRAFPFTEVDMVTMRVREDLYLYVAWADDCLFYKDSGITERRKGLGLCVRNG